ncbi:MAG: DUF4845 domain-containing protein [Rhodocyclaceae bacterium]|nr:DUF4845 domain-containing protein [Rhodocyclaceae bacterium]
MKHQRGVSLSGLLVVGALVAMVAVLGMKLAPDVIDYYKSIQAINAVAADSAGKSGTVGDIRKAFDRYANINNIDGIKGVDLDVTKEGNDIVLSFAYTKRIPLFGNVSLLIDFEGSTAK